MKKFYALLLTLVVLAALAIPTAAFASSPEHDVKGKITAISASHLTIKPATGAAVTIKVKGSTLVLMDGKRVAFNTLKVGDYVDANYNAKLVATQIDKESPDPNP